MSAKSDPVRRARREGRAKLTHGERMASGLAGRPLQCLVRTRAGATPVGANRQESAGRVQSVADEGDRHEASWLYVRHGDERC